MPFEESAARTNTLQERLLDTQDKGLLLAGCPLLVGLARPFLEELVRAADVVTAYKGQTLMEEGESCPHIMQVVRGRLEVRVESISPNMEIAINKVAPGEIVGETLLFDDGPRHVTVVASEPAVLLQIPAALLRELCDREPEVARLLYRNAAGILAARLRRSNQRLVTHLRRLTY
ncbi:MAG: cyclic nucleotide-binding domain-containing protein [Candidatus Sumerlaeia bacterium]|nr:cyclic nucleotide-binding domain-containing protein [Candidatus Sumerlaeia bacterium]